MRIKVLKREVRKIVLEANIKLRKDVLSLLNQAEKREKNRLSKKYLKTVIENSEYALKEKLPVCQDTGLGIVFMELGRGADFGKKEVEVIKEEVTSVYKDSGFRNSVVSPFNRIHPKFGPPEVYVEYTNKKKTEVFFMAKGFGSENKTKLFMLNPNEEITPYVLSAVKAAGPEACPPFVIGIGIGGTSEKALFLAKKALLEDLSKQNKNTLLNKLEKNLLKQINKLNIGPMGMGGLTTALAVRAKEEKTHIAGLPLGVNISCWALRSASAVIS